jgi:two-component system sensor histidine kinase KdpD
MRAPAAGLLRGTLASAAAVAAVTGAIFALRPVAPVLSLGVLYVAAVVVVASIFGLAYALPVSVASMLVFNWFFLPPVHTLRLDSSENWVALAVYLVTAVVVSKLATRSRRRAAEAEQRRRESSFLAGVSASLLQARHVQDELPRIAAEAGRLLGVSRCRIELDSVRRPDAGEAVHELRVHDRRVGQLLLSADEPVDGDALARLLPALASVLAVAVDRESFARRALEAEALRRSDAAKTALLRAVSHDLRSPLTAIRAASDGLASETLDLAPADRSALVDAIRLEAGRLERLVSNLLELSRLEVGSASPRRELWTVDDIVGRALDDVGAAGDRVVARLPDGLPPVQVDGGQIERVLVNVLENALKFSPGDVLLGAALDGAEVVLHVTDRGPGVDPAEAERIFSPFERGQAPPPGAGSGLGLAIARGLAEANGGRLWVEPAEPSGATFALALPLARARVPARS